MAEGGPIAPESAPAPSEREGSGSAAGSGSEEGDGEREALATRAGEERCLEVRVYIYMSLYPYIYPLYPASAVWRRARFISGL